MDIQNHRKPHKLAQSDIRYFAKKAGIRRAMNMSQTAIPEIPYKRYPLP
jgi:hypothetical protein